MKAFLAMAALAATILSGCLADDSDVPVLTAMEAREAADRAAQAWSEDAELYLVSSFEIGREAAARLRQEMQEHQEEMEGEDGWNGTGDEGSMEDSLVRAALEGSDAPGDGRARAWGFTYFSNATQASLSLLVDSRGVFQEREVPSDGTEGFPFPEAAPVQEWEIDSDEAAGLAAEANATFARHQGEPDAMATALLIRPEGDDPFWLFSLGNETEEAFAIVNARNGTIVSLQEFLGRFLGFLFPQEAGTFSYTLTALQSQGSDLFGVEADVHSRMAVSLVLPQPVPLSTVSLTLTDPEGRATILQATATGLPPVQESVVLEDVPAGTYSIQVELSSGAAQSVRVEWCTDGMPTPYSQFVQACDLVTP